MFEPARDQGAAVSRAAIELRQGEFAVAVRRIIAISASPASKMVMSRLRMPDTSRSICSGMVRTVFRLPEILMTEGSDCR